MKGSFRAFTLVAALCVLAVMAGCATVHNAQQAVLQVRVDYTVAVEAAATYGNPNYIPLCTTPPTTKICASPQIVKSIKVAKDAAAPVIDQAEATVLDPRFDQSKAEAIVLSAQNALKALTAITTALNLKPPTPTPKP